MSESLPRGLDARNRQIIPLWGGWTDTRMSSLWDWGRHAIGHVSCLWQRRDSHLSDTVATGASASHCTPPFHWHGVGQIITDRRCCHGWRVGIATDPRSGQTVEVEAAEWVLCSNRESVVGTPSYARHTPPWYSVNRSSVPRLSTSSVAVSLLKRPQTGDHCEPAGSMAIRQ